MQTLSRLAAEDAAALATGRHINPFSVLGPHRLAAERWVVRSLVPGAEAVCLAGDADGTGAEMTRIGDGIFEVELAEHPGAYRLQARRGEDRWEVEDPYRFGPVIGELDEHLIAEGTHQALWNVLGAHIRSHEGVDGVSFAVWAPAAERVSVVGDFNDWDGRRHVMRWRGS
ncbi:MAG: 1,4-alpha-glucan branching enzyme, partial [Pseudomonadota bacterium]